MKIFYIKEYQKNIIFYKIQIKSFSKLNSKTIKNLNSSTINRYFAFYDKKIKFKFNQQLIN
jgi:ABC-type amino acid transport system permease subunit